MNTTTHFANRIDPTAAWPFPNAEAPATLTLRSYPLSANLPPLPRNEMNAINAEPQDEADFEGFGLDELDAELKAIEASLAEGRSGETAALIAEMSEGSVQGEGADDEAEALEVLDAAAEPEADDSESAPAVKKRVHRRPTVDRLYADFARPGRLSPAQLSAMRARCATLPGFRAAVHEFVAASVLRRPAFAHLYRYPHPRTLETMHARWLHEHQPLSTDVAGFSVYDELTAAAVAVPL